MVVWDDFDPHGPFAARANYLVSENTRQPADYSTFKPWSHQTNCTISIHPSILAGTPQTLVRLGSPTSRSNLGSSRLHQLAKHPWNTVPETPRLLNELPKLSTGMLNWESGWNTCESSACNPSYSFSEEKKKKHSPTLLHDRLFGLILCIQNAKNHALETGTMNSSFKNGCEKSKVQHGEIFTPIGLFLATMWRFLIWRKYSATSSEFVNNDKWRGGEMAGTLFWLSCTLLHGHQGTLTPGYIITPLCAPNSQ